MVAVSLYFHIPFCTKKCPYCHFYVVPDRPVLREAFMEGLKVEWSQRKPLLAQKKVTSLYFGGGTPTLFAPEGISELLTWVREMDGLLSEECEITIEANPEHLSRSLLRALYELGINRLSLGVQSLDEDALSVLERTHSAEQAIQTIEHAYAVGFRNISIDLMYDLPWQTEASWSSTLNRVKELPITHLSLYNLEIEPHTSFFKRKESLKKVMPHETLSLKLLHIGVSLLEQWGFVRYEISAFAKNGFESRHNSGYWTGLPFLGFGPSAFSYWEGTRFQNNPHLQRYKRLLLEGNSAISFEEKLPSAALWKERLAINLRLLEGVDIGSWPLPPETLAILEALKNQGLLINKNHHWRLSPLGTLFYDTVAQELV